MRLASNQTGDAGGSIANGAIGVTQMRQIKALY
jgi:hypothetical protein